MCKSEWLDRNERKFCKPYEELIEESNSKKIHKHFIGSLKPSDESIINKFKPNKEVI